MWRRCITAAVLILAMLRPCIAQQRAQDQIRRIAIGGPLTVKMADGRELHGHLSAVEADFFSVREADLQQTLQIRYSDAVRVTAGYGGKGFMGRRVNPQHRVLIAVLVVGGLVALVLAAVASDKS